MSGRTFLCSSCTEGRRQQVLKPCRLHLSAHPGGQLHPKNPPTFIKSTYNLPLHRLTLWAWYSLSHGDKEVQFHFLTLSYGAYKVINLNFELPFIKTFTKFSPFQELRDDRALAGITDNVLRHKGGRRNHQVEISILFFKQNILHICTRGQNKLPRNS